MQGVGLIYIVGESPTTLFQQHQAVPTFQRKADDVFDNIGAMRSDIHDLKQDVRGLRAQGFRQLTEVSRDVGTSKACTETGIISKLNEYGEQMHNLGQDIKRDISQDKGGQLMRLEALVRNRSPCAGKLMIYQDQQTKSLQISMMSLPSLLKSVCERSSLMGSPEDRSQRLDLRSRPRYRRTDCKCNTKRNRVYHRPMRRKSLGRPTNICWNMSFIAQYTDHEATCPLSAASLGVFTATFWAMTFLRGAIDASISITRGAGGFSISPNLQYRRMVPNGSPSFVLVSFRRNELREVNTKHALDSLLSVRLMEIQRLFASRQASPYDVNVRGDTILHVSAPTPSLNVNW